MVELVGKKLGLLILDTVGLGVSACRFGIPRPEEFFVKRQAQLNALAVTLRCVIVPATSEDELVSAIHASSERLGSLLAELFQDLSVLMNWENQQDSFVQKVIGQLSQHTHLLFDSINAHLRLIGSRVGIDREVVTRCEAILRALPAEFGKEKVAGST